MNPGGAHSPERARPIAELAEWPASSLTAEIARRRGGQWYRLSSGRYLLGLDYGPSLVPGCERVEWPSSIPEDYLLDTDPFPDFARNASAAIRLALEMREAHGDPYRLNLETDERGRRRWLALFRKSLARAGGIRPAEAMCRSYLVAHACAHAGPAR